MPDSYCPKRGDIVWLTFTPPHGSHARQGGEEWAQTPQGSSPRPPARSGVPGRARPSAPPFLERAGSGHGAGFTPHAGHEQAGHRPALILSPALYNKKVGLALVCPITTEVTGYPFEVAIPKDLAVQGVVLADQVKSLDWKARRARFCCTVPAVTMAEVLRKLAPLIGEPTIL